MDEIDNSPINFSWIYFICRAKIKLTHKESGRLTLRQFLALYEAYRNTFDTELLLTINRKTYEAARKESEASEEWL